jgi:hypothetical protein
LKALGSWCGVCHLCRGRVRPKGAPRPRHRLVVSKLLREYQGQKGILPMHVSKAKRVHDTVCLLVQALFAFASARSGVALRVGEKVYVWRPCRKGHETGEWVRGSILAFDPVAVAHFVTFERMRPGRVVEPAHDKDDWLQLWRSGECVVASPPPVWTA